MDLIKAIEKELMPVQRTVAIEVGDTVRVHYKIKEGTRERVQIFEGIVIAIDNKGISKTFTVRKISFDVGVERVFPYYSPRIGDIEVVRKGKRRRAKLYYLRERTGKSAKVKERRVKGKLGVPVSEEPVAAAPAGETTPSAESAE